MSTKYLQLIGSNLDSQSNIVTLKVPTLESGATDYTDADKTSVQTAITEIANAKKPVVILDYNGSYMPANYFVSGTHHYFTVIGTDKVVDNSGSLYLVYIDYDESNNTLVIQYDVSLGSGGSDPELAEDVEELKQQMADLMYEEIDITNFTNNIKTVEIGSFVNTVTINWTTNKTPTELTLDGAPVSVDETELQLYLNRLGSNKTFTLIAKDERGATDTATTSISFLHGVYYGVYTQGGTIDNDFVLGLTCKLQSGKAITFTANAAQGELIAFALPQSYGTPSFNVGGFDGGFHLEKTFEFTNASGHTETYCVWLSDNAGLGNTTVKVN